MAVGLASTEELGLGLVDGIRGCRRHAARGSPYLSLFPASLDEGAQPKTYRFHDPAWDVVPEELPAVVARGGAAARLRDVRERGGAVRAGVPVYEVALRAVADLPVRVLLPSATTSTSTPCRAAPDNVRIERWVPQQDVLRHAASP